MTVTIHVGDCIDVLRTMPAESVHCVVTSPPYYGLRDYGTAEWEGGDAECDHREIRGGNGAASAKQVTSGGTQDYQYRDTCAKCGAARIDRQIGLEESPEAYVAKLVEVFREVRRVLHRTGVCWLNLGDSYAGGGGFSPGAPTTPESKSGKYGMTGALKTGGIKPQGIIKPKDLMMIPARVALALQADGWWLRSQVIWHKPNAMPESVTDRPTTDYECVYLLAKEARYFYDADAIREEHSRNWAAETVGAGYIEPWQGRNDGGKRQGNFQNPAGRNKRTVWTIPTKPSPGSHFAVFPPDLVEPMILAGTSERGACPECGCQWERVVEKESHSLPTDKRKGRIGHNGTPPQQSGWFWKAPDVTGEYWRPTCDHEADPIPAVVLDIFAGAGTALMVADRLGRDAIGIELNEDYATMSARRIYEDAGMFADVEVIP